VKDRWKTKSQVFKFVQIKDVQKILRLKLWNDQRKKQVCRIACEEYPQQLSSGSLLYCTPSFCAMCLTNAMINVE